MAVLVQRLVEAEYAFVVHTVNPSNDDKDYMYAEVVVGLGETLVLGLYSGSIMARLRLSIKALLRLSVCRGRRRPRRDLGPYSGCMKALLSEGSIKALCMPRSDIKASARPWSVP